MVISLWTVCLEEQFYIIWGRLLTLISHKRKLIAVIISLLIAAISLRSYVQDHSASHNEYYYNTITHMDPLLMGALLAISWDTFAEKMKPWGSVSFFLSMVIITSIIIYVPDICKLLTAKAMSFQY
jgi:peptidoglycan/LPS O-acetylase OafA/YrhL